MLPSFDVTRSEWYRPMSTLLVQHMPVVRSTLDRLVTCLIYSQCVPWEYRSSACHVILRPARAHQLAPLVHEILGGGGLVQTDVQCNLITVNISIMTCCAFLPMTGIIMDKFGFRNKQVYGIRNKQRDLHEGLCNPYCFTFSIRCTRFVLLNTRSGSAV